MEDYSSNLIRLLEQLEREQTLPVENYERLITERNDTVIRVAAEMARHLCDRFFSRNVYTRGLIEFSNICQNDCFYCGLRHSKSIRRYRLTLDEILRSCRLAWELDYRTFVLQSGEDMYFTRDRLVEIIQSIREEFPEAALTLSIGERDRACYQACFDAGADRFLLRHESADAEHYASLHPAGLALESRMQCLQDLKEIGYQVGAGFMVGSPGQTARHIAQDLKFIETFDPEMVGVGPFIPSEGTPFAEEKAGSLELSCYVVSLLRIQNPQRLIPATTAVASLNPEGRIRALDSGANVIMPNVTPLNVRGDYMLYNGKICITEEAHAYRDSVDALLAKHGYERHVGRGDYKEDRHALR